MVRDVGLLLHGLGRRGESRPGVEVVWHRAHGGGAKVVLVCEGGDGAAAGGSGGRHGAHGVGGLIRKKGFFVHNHSLVLWKFCSNRII